MMSSPPPGYGDISCRHSRRRVGVTPLPERGSAPAPLDPIILGSRRPIGRVFVFESGRERLQRVSIARKMGRDAGGGAVRVVERLDDALRAQRIERHGGIADREPVRAAHRVETLRTR